MRKPNQNATTQMIHASCIFVHTHRNEKKNNTMIIVAMHLRLVFVERFIMWVWNDDTVNIDIIIITI